MAGLIFGMIAMSDAASIRYARIDIRALEFWNPP
jgi:hypothetical protein